MKVILLFLLIILFSTQLLAQAKNNDLTKTYEYAISQLETKQNELEQKLEYLRVKYDDSWWENKATIEQINRIKEQKEALKNKFNELNKYLPEVCSLSIIQLEIRQLKLNKNKADIFLDYPNCKTEISNTCSYRAEDLKDAALKKNVDAISITFDKKQKISLFSIIYDSSILWNSIKEFAVSVSDNLGLPSENWSLISPKNKKAYWQYNCSNYYLKAEILDNNYPQLTVSKTSELLKLEQNEVRSQKKKDFKP